MERADVMHLRKRNRLSPLLVGSKYVPVYVQLDPVEGIFVWDSQQAFEQGDTKAVQFQIRWASDIKVGLCPAPIQARKPGSFYISAVTSPRNTRRKLELVSLKGIEDAREWVSYISKMRVFTVNIYRVGANGQFPEYERGVKTRVGLCFSGGGARAHTCAASHLRVLYHLGLLNNNVIDYISAVSGGSWATSIYTFYEKGAENDDELLGDLMTTDFEKWDLETLQNQVLCPLIRPVLEDLLAIASELVWTVNSHDLWERVLGKVYLRPFGLNKSYPFAIKSDVDRIRADNPLIRSSKIIVPRDEARPFWLCNGTIIGPQQTEPEHFMPIQFSALYTGTPFLRKIRYGPLDNNKKKSRSKIASQAIWVGGGMIDTFGFGGDHPQSESTDALVTMAVNLRQIFRETRSRHRQLAQTQFRNVLEEVQEAIDHLHLKPNMIPQVFRDSNADLLMKHRHRNESEDSDDESPSKEASCVTKTATIPIPAIPFSLRRAVAISSDAPSAALHKMDVYYRLNCQTKYWTPLLSEALAAEEEQEGILSPSKRNIHNTHKGPGPQGVAPPLKCAVMMEVGDGVSLDNLGLLPMLQRKVSKIVLFCNSECSLPFPNPTVDIENHVTEPPTYDEWPDSDILPLFGQKVNEQKLKAMGIHTQYNRVFPISELRPLLSSFQEKVLKGEPVVVRKRHCVLQNSYWGVDGGWEVNILWVYLEDSALFRNMLPKSTVEELDKGAKGEFARFPLYKTIGQNKLTGVHLTIPQANLLSLFSEWQLMYNKDLLLEFLATEKA